MTIALPDADVASRDSLQQQAIGRHEARVAGHFSREWLRSRPHGGCLGRRGPVPMGSVATSSSGRNRY
jgi:hypothetical protein